jgi:hypothetical protein
MLMHIVLHLLPDEARVESSWCAPFGSIHLDRSGRLIDWGLKWLGGRGGRHITPLHMISPIVGPSRQRLFLSHIKLEYDLRRPLVAPTSH